MAEFFEGMMLVCFGFAWPFSIHRSLITKKAVPLARGTAFLFSEAILATTILFRRAYLPRQGRGLCRPNPPGRSWLPGRASCPGIPKGWVHSEWMMNV